MSYTELLANSPGEIIDIEDIETAVLTQTLLVNVFGFHLKIPYITSEC
jgi:hypothetical protein